MFGRLGENLSKRRYGLDDRPVQTHRVRKSVSVETTFSSDISLQRIGQIHLPQLMKKLQTRWQKLEQQYVISGQVVKLKFTDFTQLTREQSGKDIHMQSYLRLLNQAYVSGSPNQQLGGARLVGLGLKLKQRESLRQLCLF
jgi:DNA polymerase-4